MRCRNVSEGERVVGGGVGPGRWRRAPGSPLLLLCELFRTGLFPTHGRPLTNHCAPTGPVHLLYTYPYRGTTQNAVFCWEFISLHVPPSLGSGLQAGDSRKEGVDASHAFTRASSVRAQDGELYQPNLAMTGRGDSSLHTALVTCYLRRCSATSLQTRPLLMPSLMSSFQELFSSKWKGVAMASVNKKIR